MKKKITMTLATGLAAALGATILFQLPVRQAQAAEGESTGLSFLTYTADGKIVRPEPSLYRKWVYVGTPLTPNDMNDGEASFPEFHAVYMDPISFASFEKTGVYPEGTVLIKELSAVGAKEASSGTGYFMGEFTGLEITVKDSVRYNDEPGNWGYYSFGHKYPLKDEATMNRTASCNACHEKTAANNAQNLSKDWVFEQYYPVLSAARAALKK